MYLAKETWSMKNFTLKQYNALFEKIKNGAIVPDANYPDYPKDVSTVAWTKVTVTVEK